jgi:hypothetical protein
MPIIKLLDTSNPLKSNGSGNKQELGDRRKWATQGEPQHQPQRFFKAIQNQLTRSQPRITNHPSPRFFSLATILRSSHPDHRNIQTFFKHNVKL